MDWQNFAAKQRQTLSEKDNTIGELSQKVTTYSKRISDLEFELAVQHDNLDRAVTTHATASADQITKLQLRARVAEEERDELTKNSKSAASREQQLLQHIDSLEATLNQQQNAQGSQAAASSAPASVSLQQLSNVQEALVLAQTENEKLRTQVQSLHRQLQVEKEENAARLPFSNRDKDDEERPPTKSPRRKSPPTETLPTKPPPQQPYGHQFASSASNPYAVPPTASQHSTTTLSAPPAIFKYPQHSSTSFTHTQTQPQPTNQSAVRKRATPRKLVTLPIRPTARKSAPTLAVLSTKTKAFTFRSTPVAQKAPATPEKTLGKTETAQRATAGKRKRSEQEQLDDEMRELGLDPNSFEDLPRSKRRQQSSLTAQPDSGLELKHLHEADMSFKFTAVTGYNRGGREGYEFEDIKGDLEELWERIEEVKDKWEEEKGQDWQYEFTKPGFNQHAIYCVTKKMEGEGCSGGQGAREQWFYLLPLHEEDRRKRVEKEFEIRYWINS